MPAAVPHTAIHVPGRPAAIPGVKGSATSSTRRCSGAVNATVVRATGADASSWPSPQPETATSTASTARCHVARAILDLPPVSTGAFDWVRRMGVHEAYHLDRTNRIIHWVCIPIELAAALKVLAALPAPVDLALVAIGLVGLVYLLTDLAAGALMVLLLLALRSLVLPLTTGWRVVDVAVALLTFGAAFVFQTRIGHGIFEQEIDDTEKNVAELRRTGNPIPILLVFFYHALELLFAMGYRPALREGMERHRAAELARIPADPRR